MTTVFSLWLSSAIFGSDYKFYIRIHVKEKKLRRCRRNNQYIYVQTGVIRKLQDVFNPSINKIGTGT